MQRPGEEDHEDDEEEVDQGTLLTSLADAQARQREKAAYEQLKAGGISFWLNILCLTYLKAQLFVIEYDDQMSFVQSVVSVKLELKFNLSFIWVCSGLLKSLFRV